MIKTQHALIAALAALVVSGCGGSGNGLLNQPNPRVRTVHAYQGVTTTSSMAGTEVVSASQAFGIPTAYAIAPEGNQNVLFADTSAPIPVLATVNELLTLSSYSTAIGYGPTGSRTILILGDTHDTTPGGQVSIRLVDVAAVQGAVDVYVTAPGATLVGKTPVSLTLTAPHQVEDYTSFAPGQYEIRAFPAGVSVGTPLVDMTRTFVAAERYTFAVLDAPTNGGSLVGVWLNDRA